MLTTALLITLCALPAPAARIGEALDRGDVVAAIGILRERESPFRSYVEHFLNPRLAYQISVGVPPLPHSGAWSPRLAERWSAYQRNPARWDLLADVVRGAVDDGHAQLMVDALTLALNQAAWPRPDGLRTVQDLRNYLYWACMQKHPRLAIPLLGAVTTRQDLGVHGIVSEAALLQAYSEVSLDAVVFDLADLVLADGRRSGATWSSVSNQDRLVIRQLAGRAEIVEFHLEPALCTWEVLRGERDPDQPCCALEFMPAIPHACAKLRARVEVAATERRPADGCCHDPSPPTRRVCSGRPPRGPVVAYALPSQGGIAVKQWLNGAWQPLGAPRGTGRNAGQPSLALGPDGEPALAYIADGSRGRVIVFERWRNGRWESLEDSAGADGIIGPLGRTTSKEVLATICGKVQRLNEVSPGGPTRPSLALDCAGNPTIAWEQTSTVDNTCCDVHVRAVRYAGSWRDLGKPMAGTGPRSGTASHPAVVIDGDDAPVVFWNAQRNGTESAVLGRRWDGAQWADLAGSSQGLPGSGRNGDPSAATNGLGQPVVFWPLCPGVAVRGALFDGQWRPFGGGQASCDQMSGRTFPVTVDATGWPVVVFLEGEGPYFLRVQRLSSRGFEDLGTPYAGARADHASLARDGDGLVLAWSDAEGVRVARWEAQRWTMLPAASPRGYQESPVIVSR